MKHSEKDKLEQFFQNSLENYGENPSAGFWSEMENRIPLPPVAPTSFWKMKGWYLSLFLMMGMLLFIGIQKWNNDKTLVDINKTIELQDREIDEISKGLTEVQNEVLSKIIVDSQKELETESKNETPQQCIYNSEREENTPALSIVENNNNVITTSKPDFVKEKTTEDFLKNTTNLTNNSAFKLSPVSIVKNISPLFFEAKKSDNNILEIPKEEIIKFNEIEKKVEGIEVFAGFHQALPGLKIENSLVDFDQLINQESNIGLLLNFVMNRRWTFQIGLGSGKSIQTGTFKKGFVYADSEYGVGDDVVGTKYYLDLQTNYHGLIKFKPVVYNSRLNNGQDIYENDSFSADINLTKKSKYFFLPMYVRYSVPISFQKLNWSIKMGLVQHVVNLQNEPTVITLSNFSHPRLSHSHTDIIRVDENFKRKYYSELVLGTGVEYYLSKKCTLILEPVFKKSIIIGGRIRPGSIGIYLGIRWSL